MHLCGPVLFIVFVPRTARRDAHIADLRVINDIELLPPKSLAKPRIPHKRAVPVVQKRLGLFGYRHDGKVFLGASHRRGHQAVMDEQVGLPSDALILEETDEAIWSDEVLEFNGLLADPRTPSPLQAYLGSYSLPTGMFCHAFEGDGQALSKFEWSRFAASDADRRRLILQLLDAVNFLHGRGSAHLGLDGDAIRLVTVPAIGADGGGQGGAAVQLRIIGLGAAVRLGVASGRSAYLMASSISYHAPELLISPVLSINIRAGFRLDSWAVGVLIAMIAGSMSTSPYEAQPNWTRVLLTPEMATKAKIAEIQNAFGDFLLAVDSGSGGFLFRHGWVVRLLLGLLQPCPSQRMSVQDAWSIALAANRSSDAAPLNPALIADTSARSTASSTVAAAAASSGAGAPAAPRSGADGRSQKEFGRFRKFAARDASAEPFRSLEAMVNICDKGAAFVVIESRPRWRGVRNYGEVVGFRNRADGDRWDVLVPGLPEALPEGVPLALERILGVVLIKGGNHKLVVALSPPHDVVDRQRVNHDIRQFIRVYAETTPRISSARIKFLSLDEIGY